MVPYWLAVLLVGGMTSSLSDAFVVTTTTRNTPLSWSPCPPSFLRPQQQQQQQQQRVVASFQNRRSTTTSSQLNMFDQLSAALSTVAQSLGARQKITEDSISGALRTVRRALLDADVNVDVADTLIAGVKRRSLGVDVIEGVTAEQQFIKAMYDELLDCMGGGGSSDGMAEELATGTAENPAVILLAGLQGAGKTTAAGKLALFLAEREVNRQQALAELNGDEAQLRQQLESRMPKRRRRVLLVAADVYRPAAIQQLQILGERIGVPVYAQNNNDDPVDICINGIAKAVAEGYDTVIVDTAGRQVIDSDLMGELKRIKKATKAAETLLIVDAMTGQEAASLTAAFDEAVGLTGAILTKLDGDSRGGAAVSVRGVSGRPIKFVGTGEKMQDLEPFYPNRMASRILGMGDVVSLVEKAAELASDEEAAIMAQKMRDATFDFDDFLKQSEMITKMGSVAGVANLIPGMNGMLNLKQIREVETRLEKNQKLIQYMTVEERQNPDLLILDPKARQRLSRITKDADMKIEDAQQFVSEFQRMRTMMSRMQKQMGDGKEQPTTDRGAFTASSSRAVRRKATGGKKKTPKLTSGRGFGSRNSEI